jgi:hypothetical protein
MDLHWRIWSDIIQRADELLAEDLSNQDVVFRNVPLEIYGHLLLGVPDCYPRLKRLLPSMPSDEVQRNWVGDCGLPLLYKGTSFVKSTLQYIRYQDIRPRNLKALDFGCGWGRLLRLFGKYFPTQNLEGVDPWDKSIELCRECKIRNPLAESDYLPHSLPVHSRQFHLIYAYSVFTHLSPRAFATCLGTLRRYIAPDGVLIITLRPVEYWLAANNPDAYRTHVLEGFSYVPHQFKVVDGDSVYGDTSVNIAYLQQFSDWEVQDVEVSYTDPLQIFVLLRPC